MKRRYTEEQIIKAIKEHESGVKVDDICRSLSISFGTFYNWRSKFAGLEVNEAENGKLKKLLTELFATGCLCRKGGLNYGILIQGMVLTWGKGQFHRLSLKKPISRG